MFESIRKHSRIAMLVMFLLIIPSFVLVGIDANYFSTSSPVVAQVDGNDITQAEWDNAHRNESDRIRAQQPGIEGALLDSPQARYATLERLVRDRVFEAAAIEMRLAPSDARLARELQNIPQIASLRNPDGTLDAEAYRRLAAAQRLTPEGFEASMRHQLAVNQVMGSITSTSFATPAQAEVALKPLFQEREIRVASFLPKDFVSKIVVTPEDLEAYYKAHEDQFRQAEQASVEYVVLDTDAVRAGIKLSEDDLKTYYRENLTQYSSKEERRVSHILVASPEDSTAVDRAAARAKADRLLVDVRKTPQSFSEIAKVSSEDSGSASAGGDLGFISRGSMVKPFEDVAFRLEEGAISDVIETGFGYHIVKLIDVKKADAPSYENKRADIEEALLQQMAQRKFAEVAEIFTNTVYEQSDSLGPVVTKLGLKLQTASGITRTPKVEDQGPIASPKVLAALFSSDSLEDRRNTEAIDVGPSQLVSARVTKYTAARTLAFDESKEKIREEFVEFKSAELARAEGEAKRSAWAESSAPIVGLLGAPIVVSRQNPKGQSAVLIEKVLSEKRSSLPVLLGVDLGEQGYRVTQVVRVLDATPSLDSIDSQRVQQYTQWWITAEALAYYELLKQHFKVKIEAPKPDPLTSLVKS